MHSKLEYYCETIIKAMILLGNVTAMWHIYIVISVSNVGVCKDTH